jgi:hypothetical protein
MKEQVLMWLKMNPRFEDRSGDNNSEVIVSWFGGGGSHTHLLKWSQLKSWMEEFYSKHPTWGLIVAEIVTVTGMKE